ncbi:hypothetical protein BU23DRAFT_28759 [Bimuria novae-zelandiae CBS 107.79]|uniref:Transcription factor domain-containing protein n=1 Tax=Bimuria novae-zelandiae CBS 107.79 TaxID=1447943 RepID=A0A6A5VH69_9PLEO|nr:hypothetical protein BU23DRAFT_28759 [Bimuria novae-zelandiae CBS 107.79]
MSLSSVDASRAMLALVEPGNIHRLVDLFLDIYLRRYGPSKTPRDPLTAGNECGGWRGLLPSWLGQSVILDTAIEGMTASFIGTQYQDVRLSNHGGKMYLNALQMAQKALPKLDASERKYLLATTLVMSSTELFLSNGAGSSQLTHIEGSTRLLNLSHDNLDLEELHVYILNQGLLEAISSRRSYPCSSPSFRHMAQQIYSVPRTNRNDLYFQWCESILPLPNILSATDNITSSTPVSAILVILDDLSALEQSIAPWYELLQSSITGPWTIPGAQTSADSVSFPLQFISIEASTNYCLYWISQLLILEARQILYAQLPITEIPDYTGPDTLQPRISEYASLVCRSVQYCTHNTSFAATENMLMPLDVVSSYYMRQGDRERLNWCIGAFARISHEHRIAYAAEKFNLANTGMRVAEDACDPDGL